MRRREFITLLGAGATAWPLAAPAQKAERMRRIGVLMNTTAEDPLGQAGSAAFAQGLQQLGWEVGSNVRVDTRWGAGDTEQYRKYATELVALAPDVILATANSIVSALQQASRTMPIVFVTTIDPVGGGLVASLARPGGGRIEIRRRSSLLPRCPLLSLRSEGQTRCGNQGGPGMKCPACGAEMLLIKVAPDKPMMVGGYEEHTFECSGCHDQVRRLVFIPRPIEPLTNAQMPRLPPARFKRPVDGAVLKSAWSRALVAVARVNAIYVGGALIAIGLAGSVITWGQDLKGPMGDRGPPGPKGAIGDPGPSSAVSSVRIVRSNCDEKNCRVQCGENEMLLTAYCGAKRNPAIMPTERAATCRAAGPANSPLLAVCARIEP